MLKWDGNTKVGQVARAEFLTISHMSLFLERYQISYGYAFYALIFFLRFPSTFWSMDFKLPEGSSSNN